MRRRDLIRNASTVFGISAVTALAGCSALSGGSGKPLTGEITGDPYVLPRDFDDNLVYVEMTVEGNPSQWPEVSVLGSTYRGFTGRVSEGEDGDLEQLRVLKLYDNMGWDPVKPWFLEKSDFENDNEESRYAVLGSPQEIEDGDSFNFYIHNPERGESYQVAEYTYEGDAETRTPTEES